MEGPKQKGSKHEPIDCARVVARNSFVRDDGYNCEDADTNIIIIDAFKVEECIPVNETKIA